MIRVTCEVAVELEGGKPVISFLRRGYDRRHLSRVAIDEETARRVRNALQEVHP